MADTLSPAWVSIRLPANSTAIIKKSIINPINTPIRNSLININIKVRPVSGGEIGAGTT